MGHSGIWVWDESFMGTGRHFLLTFLLHFYLPFWFCFLSCLAFLSKQALSPPPFSILLLGGKGQGWDGRILPIIWLAERRDPTLCLACLVETLPLCAPLYLCTLPHHHLTPPLPLPHPLCPHPIAPLHCIVCHRPTQAACLCIPRPCPPAFALPTPTPCCLHTFVLTHQLTFPYHYHPTLP